MRLGAHWPPLPFMSTHIRVGAHNIINKQEPKEECVKMSDDLLRKETCAFSGKTTHKSLLVNQLILAFRLT